MRLRTSLPVLFLLLFAGNTFAATPTFNKEVSRILQQHCQTCHRPGNIAPFSLLTYSEARTHAFEIKAAVESHVMPPWKPVNAHGVFEGERYLTPSEIQTLSDWALAGAPEGASADTPEAISFPETWSAGTPDLVTQPSTSYPLQAGADDIYRCFPLPITNADINVRGYEVLPGNRAIVHHVIAFIDTLNLSAKLDADDPGPGYTCFGGAGFLFGLSALGAWAPGAPPSIFPLGTGVKIPAGARIVMQVHYSTSEVRAGTPLDDDLTKIGLYTTPASLDPLSFLPVVNTSFTIPAGNSHYEVKASLPILSTVDLVAVAPHMHLLGREQTLVAKFPDGTSRQLIRIADWDFHWQANYVLKEPITLPPGTIVELTAVYDNSTGNPKNPTNPPVPVSWGERTTDEMALAFLTVKSPGTPTMNTVPFSLTDRGSESVVTQGNSGTLRVGYARVTDASGAAPSGLAIFGYRQNGILISEAGVPASRLISQGRIYGQTNTGIGSGLAIANPNSDAAAISFTFTDETGTVVKTGSFSITGGNQKAAFLDQDPFNGPSTFSGSFSFSSSKPVAVVALRGVVNERTDFLLTTLPVVEIGGTASTSSVVFPHFADGGGWTTTFMLVNPTDSAISGTLQFRDPSGAAITSLNATYSIPARSARRISTAGSGSTVRSGAASVVPDAGNAAPVGSLVFSYSKGGIRLTEAGVPSTAAGTAFRVYVEASDAISSGIAIANTAATASTLRFELTNLSGASIATTTMSLAGNAQVSKFLTEIPGFENLSMPIQGLLRITSTTPVSIVGLRSRVNERTDFLITTTPPVSESTAASSELYFPHFADDGGYTTQFILFSASSRSSVSASIKFFSQAGTALDLPLR